MKRFIFNTLAAASLLFCLASMVLWVRSYWTIDKIQVVAPAWRELATYNGRLHLAGSQNTYVFPLFQSEAIARNVRYAFDQPDYDWILFRWGGIASGGYWFVGVQLWLIMLVTAILPAVRIRQLIRARPSQIGICRMCGYDLRATPDRCPECGTIPPPKATPPNQAGARNGRTHWLKWGPWYPPATSDASPYELALRRRLRFLLPTSLCILFMLGYLFMASDAIAIHESRELVIIGSFEILLAANIVARRRVAKKLDRLLAGCCVYCGYDLRATPDRCPECGTVPARAESKLG